MRKFVIIILILFYIYNASSQDTATLKYFPLKVGNTWIHSCSAIGNGCVCGQYIRNRITNTIQKYGKYYFIFSTQNIVTQTCYGSNCFQYILPSDTLRIDSATCNIYRFSENSTCSLNPHEILIDSLKAKLHDSSYTKCHTDFRVCEDTSSINIFGALRKSKFMIALYFESAASEIFVKGIGLKGTHSEGMNCSSWMDLKGCVIDNIVYGDTLFPVGVNIISTEVPKEFLLYQNFPNPFNPSTKIKFAVSFSPPRRNFTASAPGKGNVKLIICDVSGKEIETLVNEHLTPGIYEVEWDGSSYSSGVYFYKLSADDFSVTKRMVLIK